MKETWDVSGSSLECVKYWFRNCCSRERKEVNDVYNLDFPCSKISFYLPAKFLFEQLWFVSGLSLSVLYWTRSADVKFTVETKFPTLNDRKRCNPLITSRSSLVSSSLILFNSSLASLSSSSCCCKRDD